MYKLQYVSKSLVSAMQNLVKMQKSVHKATQTRLEHEQWINKKHHSSLF